MTLKPRIYYIASLLFRSMPASAYPSQKYAMRAACRRRHAAAGLPYRKSMKWCARRLLILLVCQRLLIIDIIIDFVRASMSIMTF